MKKKNIKNNKIKELFLNQKGMALLTTLIFVFILVTFAVALLIMTSNDTKLSALQRDSTKAFYIAEAGMERTLYNLKKDYESYQEWGHDNKINEYLLDEGGTSEFRKIAYDYDIDSTIYDVTFGDDTYGDGTYTVALRIIGSKNVTIKSKGKYNKSTRYVQVDAKIGPLSIWDNAIFAGAGASGRVINGNVDIRGSVHLLGIEGGDAIDIGVEVGGTGGIGNNYDGMDSDLRSRIPLLKQVDFKGELVDTLNAKLKVMNGDVNLSGDATVGDPDISGNSFKETLDGVYVNGDFGGNQGISNVYSDEIEPYENFIAGTFEFPTLDDFCIDPNTGLPYSESDIDPDTGDPYYNYYIDPETGTHNNYNAYLDAVAYEISSLYDVEGELLENISSIDSTINSFIGENADGDEIINWDNDTGTLSISGVIVTSGDFSIGDKNNSIVYDSKGTIVSRGDISIHGNILAELEDGVAAFPGANALGFVAYNDINIAKGSGDSQLKMMGAFYGENKIVSAKQNQIAGTFVSNYFDMGGQVPSIYQVPGLEYNLPPGMPGAVVTYRIYTSNWHEVRE